MTKPMCAALLALAAVLPHPALADVPHGLWANPKNTVHVKTAACGQYLCGWVDWASPQATADAKDSGVSPLVGVELLRSYRPVGDGRWQGRVFVPDWNRTFSSTIQSAGPGALKISGCVIGGFLCKSQVWRQI